MGLNQKIEKMSSKNIIKMYAEIGEEIRSLQEELDSKTSDPLFIDLPDNELLAHKHRLDFLHVKTEQLLERQKSLKQSALDRMDQEAKAALPSIDKELDILEDTRKRLEKEALVHILSAEEIDCYIRLHPPRPYLPAPEIRPFCEDQRALIKKAMGLGHPSLIIQRNVLRARKQLAETQTDYTPEFQQLILEFQK